jgi:twinkle protein
LVHSQSSKSKVVELHQPCPNPDCGSSDAYCEYDDGHGWCFSCNYYKPGDNDAIDNTNYSYQYLDHRGIDANTYAFYGAKTKVNPTGKPVSIGFEYSNGSIKIRQLDKKAFHSVGDIGKAGLYGKNKFPAGSARYITVTEGEHDAHSLYQVLKAPVVSVQSSVTAVRDCSIDRAYLNSFERIYLAFDNDTQGREACRQVARLFDFNKIYVVRLSPLKDANDWVQAGKSEELKKIWWNSKKYLPETVISSFYEFENILKEEPQYGIPYPFPTLNHMTYGIRRGESVLLTAQEGVGKTEIMHTIEHQILKETKDALAAIYLEEPKRRHLQALAGIELRRPIHLPEYDPGVGEVYRTLTEVVGVDDRLHVYSHFGSDDPEILLDTIRFLVSARNCYYVLFDHISMAVSGLGGEDERKALDYLSTRLEMMVKELNFALIFVSHVNDLGQTRGSRNIAKVADIRIDAVRDLINPDPVIRNTTKLTISKNRFSGKTGPAGNLLFDPATYTLSEFTGEPANDNSIARSSRVA